MGTRGSSAPCPSPACLAPPNILSRGLQEVCGRGSGTRVGSSSRPGSGSSCAPGPAPSDAASSAPAAPQRSSCSAAGPLSTGAPRHSWVSEGAGNMRKKAAGTVETSQPPCCSLLDSHCLSQAYWAALSQRSPFLPGRLMATVHLAFTRALLLFTFGTLRPRPACLIRPPGRWQGRNSCMDFLAQQ